MLSIGQKHALAMITLAAFGLACHAAPPEDHISETSSPADEQAASQTEDPRVYPPEEDPASEDPGSEVPTGPQWACDVDGDGTLTASDSELAYAFVMQTRTPTSVEFRQADVSPIGHPDGVLDLSDVSVISRATAGEPDLCWITNEPPIDPIQDPYEWQQPETLGVGDPVFPDGPYVDVTNMPSECSGCPEAAGDGVTDDAEAISFAIRYACQNDISNVYIPPGNYAIGSRHRQWSYSGIGYETYQCPGTVEIFGAGPETVLMPKSPVGNFLFHVCYDWASDIPIGNPNHSGFNCYAEDNVYVPTSRLVLHDMTWLDPNPIYSSYLQREESHGLKVFPTLGSLEVYNITVVDLGDEAMDLNMHEDSHAHLHHNEFYGVPSIGGGSAYAAYSGGDIIFENSISDALEGSWGSSRFGSCFDINPNSVPGRRFRNVVIRDNWCRARSFGAKFALTGEDDQPIEWLQLENNHIEVSPDVRDLGDAASIRLVPNSIGENDAYILGGVIQDNELYGPLRFHGDGIFDVSVLGNSIYPARSIVGELAVISASPTNPVQIVAPHALVDGQQVKFVNVYGMTELIGNTYTVINSEPGQPGTFELLGENGVGRDAGANGTIQYFVAAAPVALAEPIDASPPTIRLTVDQDFTAGSLIETSGFEQLRAIDDRRFEVKAATSTHIDIEVDTALGSTPDVSPGMQIRLVPDGHGVDLRGRGITFGGNTVSGFADSCVVVHPVATNASTSCEEGLLHTVDVRVVDNDFDCDGGQLDDSHFILARPLFGQICDPDPGVPGEYIVSGNTFMVDEQPNWARGAVTIGNAWPNVVVADNQIYRPSTETEGKAIDIAYAPDPHVANNAVRWAGDGISLRSLEGAVVENNKVEQFGTAPYFAAGFTLTRVDRGTVHDNTTCGSSDGSPDGIEDNVGTNNSIVGNVVVSAGCFAAP